MIPPKVSKTQQQWRQTASKKENEDESIGMFLVWMFLHSVFTLLLAASLALAA